MGPLQSGWTLFSLLHVANGRFPPSVAMCSSTAIGRLLPDADKAGVDRRLTTEAV
jgi:hypothetical protein